MKLIGIVGTNSTRSTNRRLLQFIQSHFSDQVEIELCEISDLPAFNEPEDRTAPASMATPRGIRFLAKVGSAARI